MKEKLKLYIVAALSFVAFSLVLFVVYVSKNLDNQSPIDASVADKSFIESYQTQAIDTPPPAKLDTSFKDRLKKEAAKQPIHQKEDSIPANEAPRKEKKAVETTVHICSSSNAYAYHANNYCQGLRNCKASINTVTKTQAESWGRRPCKKCY